MQGGKHIRHPQAFRLTWRHLAQRIKFLVQVVAAALNVGPAGAGSPGGLCARGLRGTHRVIQR